MRHFGAKLAIQQRHCVPPNQIFAGLWPPVPHSTPMFGFTPLVKAVGRPLSTRATEIWVRHCFSAGVLVTLSVLAPI